MSRLILVIFITAALGLVLPDSATASEPSRPLHTLRLCPSDEGPDANFRYCIWDARHMGNHRGTSFKIRRDNSIRFLTHYQAERKLAKHGWFFDRSSECWFHADYSDGEPTDDNPPTITWDCDQ